jgi:hypothetical protein
MGSILSYWVRSLSFFFSGRDGSTELPNTTGAMGCGAYLCPPGLVAGEMKAILLEPEFKGWFRRVAFAVYSKPDNGGGNFAIFEETFKDIYV